MSESGFIAEGYARQLVPDAQLGGGHRVFFIVAGALCGLPGFVLAAQVVHGMGLARARSAFLVGRFDFRCARCLERVFRGAYAHESGHAGRRGIRPARRPRVKTVIALSLIGWVGVILSVLGATAGSAIHSLYGVDIDSAWIAIAAAIAVAGITLHGVRGLEQVGMVIAPLLLVLLAYTFYKGCPSGAVSVLPVPASLGFGAAVSAVVGEYVVGIVIQPDYGRFVRRPVGAGIASGLALGVAFPCILTLSAIPTFTCRASDLIAVMVAVGIGLPAIVLLVLGAWTDASACLYSGSLSLTNEVRRFRLPWVTVFSAAIGCVFAIFHAERVFMPFLALLGVTFPPVAAINILHTLWQRRDSLGRTAAAPPAIRWAGVLAWAAGSIAGYLTSNGYFTVTRIASIDSVLIAAGVWLLATAVGRARQARQVRASS